MQKRAPLTDENTNVGLNAKQFQDALEKLKSGVRFGYTCNQTNLKKLKLDPGVLNHLLNRTCYLPTPEPLTTVSKILPVEIVIDLSPEAGRHPQIITVSDPNWDPSPSSKTELDNGPPHGYRTDVILYQKMRILRIYNNSPFDLVFYCNLHNFYANMTDAINATAQGKVVTQWPTLRRTLDEPDGSPCRGGIPLLFSENMPEEGIEIQEKDGTITQFLDSAQTDMSAACYYCADESIIRGGIVEFEMPHPVTRKLAWFSAMSCGHIVASHVIHNWEEWNLQVTPLVDNSQNTFTLLLEKSFTDEVIQWMIQNMPQKSFAVPTSNVVFGVARHNLDQDEQGRSHHGPDSWRSSYKCRTENPNLSGQYRVKAEVMLTYGLLPQELPKDKPFGLFSAGEQMATTNNSKEMHKKLQREAKLEVESDLTEFSFSKLSLSSPDAK